MSDDQSCVACSKPGQYSILVSSTPNEDGAVPGVRHYLPNQTAREHDKFAELWFCADCMRQVEDNFRATILYLQSENGLVDA